MGTATGLLQAGYNTGITGIALCSTINLGAKAFQSRIYDRFAPVRLLLNEAEKPRKRFKGNLNKSMITGTVS